MSASVHCDWNGSPASFCLLVQAYLRYVSAVLLQDNKLSNSTRKAGRADVSVRRSVSGRNRGVPAKIEKVTSDNILRAARKYFDLDGYALGVVRGQNGDMTA